MPAIEESLDYERFSYEEPSPRSMTLDDAIKAARELRQGDGANFYRVEPVDQNANLFRVACIPASSVYAEFIARIAKTMGRYTRLNKK